MKTKISAILLVIFTTFLTSIAQVFYKSGADKLSFDLLELITNYQLITGLFLYGIGALILVIALKGGDLSVLYPIISTSYIWVALFSMFIFDENINLFRWLGIFTIIFGIILITTSKQKEAAHFTDPV